MTTAYYYDETTGEYLSSYVCAEDPLEGGPIVKGFSTLTSPLVAATNQVAVTDPVLNSTNVWRLEADYRGQTWYLPDGTPYTFTEIGDEPTPTMMPELPADVVLSQAKTDKEAELRIACTDEIHSGFSSNALGTVHNYPSTAIDQLNLNGCVTGAIIDSLWSGPFWCEIGGVWDRRIHDATQIKAVGITGAEHVRNNQNKFKTKLDQVTTATTIMEVDAVVW